MRVLLADGGARVTAQEAVCAYDPGDRPTPGP